MTKPRGLLSFLMAASLVILATAEPLKTTSSRVMTVEGPDSSSDGALMINVLRTDDLIADHIPSKPLLLEKISHLVIRVEIKANQCLINGHPMPLTHAHSDEMLSKGMMTEDTDPHTGHRQLKMTVEMKQVQTLKLPKDSPLVPLGLSKPELLQISEQYMAEGVVGAVLSISEEPVEVDVSTVDGQKLDAQAIKITIGIQIAEIDGVVLSMTELPSTDLLELIVHTEPEDPSKVIAITTLAPPGLSEPAPSVSEDENISSIMDLLAKTSAEVEDGLWAAMNMVSNLMDKIKAPAEELSTPPPASHHRGPCKGHHHHHHPQDEAPQAVEEAVEAVEAVEEGTQSPEPEALHADDAAFAQSLIAAHEASHDQFQPEAHGFKLGCMIKMIMRTIQNSSNLLKFAIPALLTLALVMIMAKVIKQRQIKKQKASCMETSKALIKSEFKDLDEKVMRETEMESRMQEEELVILISSVDDRSL